MVLIEPGVHIIICRNPQLQLAPCTLFASFTHALVVSMLKCCTVVPVLALVQDIRHNLNHVPWQNQPQMHTLVRKGLTPEVD